jgi:hypothetical protein
MSGSCSTGAAEDGCAPTEERSCVRGCGFCRWGRSCGFAQLALLQKGLGRFRHAGVEVSTVTPEMSVIYDQLSGFFGDGEGAGSASI